MSEPSHSPTATTTATPTPLISVHRWPWRTEEFVSMAVACVVVLGVGYLILDVIRDRTSSTFALAWIIGVVGAAFAAVYFLYRVKDKRVSTSQVTITILGTTVRAESRGRLGKSQADISKTATVSYRKFNSDETFMISDGDKTVRIPVRATTDANVRRVVDDAFTTADAVSAEARDLYQRMPVLKTTTHEG